MPARRELGPAAQDALGTCMMFALEKVMRTGSNVISVNWQRSSTTGAIVKKVIKPVMPRQAILPAGINGN